VLLLTFAPSLALIGCADPADDVKLPHGHDDTAGDGTDTSPIDVSGWGSDVQIAESGDSQGEPSVTTAADGTLIASWMQDEGYDIYIRYSRSTDGGQTWSDPEYIHKDRWGYQNDPVVIQSGDTTYFSWLAIEGQNYDIGNIYCAESHDNGATWSDPVALTDGGDNDREWLATDGQGGAIITWDYFHERGYDEDQIFRQTSGGCANFSDPEIVVTGGMLNGVPAYGPDGKIWASRNNLEDYEGHIAVTEKVGGEWVDHDLYSYEYPQMAMRAHQRRRPIQMAWNHKFPSLGHYHHEDDGGGEGEDHDSANGTYDGETSPVTYVQPDGTVVSTALVTQRGGEDGEVMFFTWNGTDATHARVSGGGEGGPKFEPWMIQDEGGGLHAIWYDGREGDWRLYGATSHDGGDTFTEYPIGDNTFQNGFDETDQHYNAWVGHFQGMTLLDDSVVAVFGDSHTSDTSWIYVDVSE
jgi:hypothetical protein